MSFQYCQAAFRLAIFVAHPTNQTSVAQGFFRWGRALGRSPDTPGRSEKDPGPVDIPLKRGASKEGQSLWGRPPEVQGCRSRHTSTEYHWNQDTPDQICTQIKPSRPKCVLTQRLPENCAYTPLYLEVIGICLLSHQPDEYGTRPFLGGSGRRAVVQTRPAFPKIPWAPSEAWGCQPRRIPTDCHWNYTNPTRSVQW